MNTKPVTLITREEIAVLTGKTVDAIRMAEFRLGLRQHRLRDGMRPTRYYRVRVLILLSELGYSVPSE